MLAILHLLVMFGADIFKSRRRLEAENLFLRYQLNIALRRAPPRLRLLGSDRLCMDDAALLDVSQVVKPETILRWHRIRETKSRILGEINSRWRSTLA